MPVRKIPLLFYQTSFLNLINPSNIAHSICNIFRSPILNEAKWKTYFLNYQETAIHSDFADVSFIHLSSTYDLLAGAQEKRKYPFRKTKKSDFIFMLVLTCPLNSTVH